MIEPSHKWLERRGRGDASERPYAWQPGVRRRIEAAWRRIEAAWRRRFVVRASTLLGLGMLTGLPMLSCSSPAEEVVCLCTAEFRFFTVAVVDAQGQPADDVSISTTRVSDGLDLTPLSDVGLGQPGVYVVLTDNAGGNVTEEGTLVEVIGTRGDTGFRAEFVFNKDACGCHVSQVSGPDTVQLTPLPPA